jgi:hypothetical protein
MMEQDLIRLFADLTDDALLERLHAGTLTEEAQSIARAEVDRRGLTFIPDPPASVQAADPPPADYVQLSRYLRPMEAYLLQGRLNAEGIDTQLRGVKTIETDPLWLNAMGGVRLFVLRQQYNQAMDVAAKTENGSYQLEDDAPPETLHSDPDAGKRRFGWAVIVIFTLLVEALVIGTLWTRTCAPSHYCPYEDHSAGTDFLRLMAVAMNLLPALFAGEYMRQRFKKNHADR